MKNSLLVLVLLVMVSCGNKVEDIPVQSVTREAFEKYVNTSTLPADSNLNLDRSIVNDAYPIEIALYKDNIFHYNLPTLRDGHGQGKWEYVDGKIELTAKLTFFKMHIEIHSTDVNANQVVIKFTDRFGPNTLKMTNVNL
jgi:hypothetical protein